MAGEGLSQRGRHEGEILEKIDVMMCFSGN